MSNFLYEVLSTSLTMMVGGVLLLLVLKIFGFISLPPP